MAKKSHFLLGPRQTGKSTFLRTLFPEAVYIDLLEADTFRRLSARPELLRHWDEERGREHGVIIDEVQKLPEILDEVQLMIDRNPSFRFLLTGSSARKLKRGKGNLLGGRAWWMSFFPLVFKETGEEYFEKRLRLGSLPGILMSSYPEEDLRQYVGVYLQEEIQAEGLSRSIGSFSRFLEFAGLCSGGQINFSSLASDCRLPVRTVRDYFSILEDTLIGSLLPVYKTTVKRKVVSSPKFYFFDIGVVNALRGEWQECMAGEILGRRFEHLIFHELKAYSHYKKTKRELSYWRTKDHLEVDFLWGDFLGIEVKSKEHIRHKDLEGLKALKEEILYIKTILVCREPFLREEDGILIYPIIKFLKDLWDDAFL